MNSSNDISTLATGEVDGRSARWAAHREERRKSLIKASRRAVHHLGPDASMEDIATAAGTSKSVYYRYFGDKAGLQQAVGEVVLNQMKGRIREAAQTATDPVDGLVNMVSAYLEMAETSPNVYAFVTQWTPENTPQSTDVMNATGALGHFFDEITGMLSRPLSASLSNSSAALLDIWPTAAIGLVRAAGELWLSSPETPQKPDHEAMAQYIAHWLLHGIQKDIGSVRASTHQVNKGS